MEIIVPRQFIFKERIVFKIIKTQAKVQSKLNWPSTDII